MKIKHLLIGVLAVAAAVACKQDEPVETPKLDVDKAAVEVAATAGEASFNVTSNQNWVASADADWVSLEPASGSASEKAVAVKVTAEDNETAEVREATVTVKAGELSKTVKVKQVAAGETPAPDHSEWALVGTFGEDNNWNPESKLYLSVLDEEYFVYYGLELATNSEFKFLKGGAWPPAGTEIGGNGLVEPNTIQPAGGSNIKVTEAGTYDIYLAADLTKFYIMSEGKHPSEATEPAPVENQWGMMGCFVDNQWSSDVPMAKEGEWIVAKGAQFTELTFKIRANASWADAGNIGVAPGSERGVVNGKISVVTAEYAKANLGGDAADIKLNGEPGTYDVYFSFENLEVYVMEQGYKPGEKEPQNPDPVEITYTVVGTLNNINWNNSAPEGLMTFDGQYHVAKNVPFVTAATLYGGADQFEFKIVETGSWTGYGRVEDVVNPVNTEIAVKLSGDNIMVSGAEGNYDVYFDKENAKVWVLTPGATPGETPEAPVTPVTEGVIWENDGTVGAAAWSGSPYRFSIEGGDALNECVAEIPAAVWAGMKIAPFNVEVKYGPEATWWQIRVLDGWWTVNDESGDSDFTPQAAGVVDNGDGTFTFQVDLAANPDLLALIDTQHLLFAGDGFIINKIYFGEAETPGEPETPAKSGWYLVGSFTGTGWGWDAAAGIELDVLDANYFVYYGLELTEGAQFKFLQGTAWGAPEVGAAASVTEPNTIQVKGTMNIAPPAGKYDIYLAADASKFFVMSEGKTPADATEPAPVEVTYTVAGTIKDNNWNNALPAALMVKEGDYLVAKNLDLLWESTCYGGAEQLAIKIFETGNWNAGYGLAAKETYAANVEIPVVANGAENISIIAPEGTYDVYLNKDNGKVWVMEPGLKPGETPAPEPEYTLDGKQWMAEVDGMQVLFDFGLAEEGMLSVGMPSMDGTGFGLYMAGLYEIVPTNGTSGVVNFTQYDWEWDEFADPVEIPYSELTATTVKAVSVGVFGTTEPISFTLVENPYEIALPQTGGDDPSGAIENGEYWIIETGAKVAMKPLSGNYGYPEAGYVLAENGTYASTVENAFTFTYDPETSYYTIQDSNGKYLYMKTKSDGSWYTSFNVGASFVDDDAYYWVVFDCGDGTYDIYNVASGYQIAYSASYNSWGVYEWGSGNALPTLVKADNPVVEPEPEVPAGTYSVSFADVANRTSFSADMQVWEENGVTVTNEKASSTNDVADYYKPARFYKGSSLKVEKAGMTKIEFYCNSYKATYPTDLQASITDANATVTVSDKVVTVTFTSAVDSFSIAKLAGQVRMDSLTVYTE